MSGRRGTFRQQVDAILAATLDGKVISAELAKFAKAEVADVIRRGDAPPSYDRWVDGVKDAPEEAVQPNGVILYQFAIIGEAALYCVEFLRRRAPQNSDPRNPERISESWWIAVNGVPIRDDSFDPSKVPADAEVIVFSRLPYARKVDVQQAGGKRLRFSVPPGMYDDAAQSLRRRYPTLNARRTYRVVGVRGAPTRSTGRVGRPVELPGVVITVRK